MPKAQQVEFLLAGVRDTNGNPLASGLVYSYSAGTLVAKALYSAGDKSTSHAQGVALDGYGRLQAWGDGAYKIIIKTAAGVTLYTWDNLVYGYDDGELKWGGTSGGSGNAQTLSIATVTALSSGMRIAFIAGFSNSGATTLNVSSLGAVSIKKIDGSTALATGDIVAGDLIDVIYESGGGGNFRLLSTKRSRIDEWCGTTGGSANAQTGTVSPAITSYVAGQQFSFLAGFTNTTSTPTLNVNSIGAKTLIRPDGQALSAGDVTAGTVYACLYDGVNLKLLNIYPTSISFTPTATPDAGSMSATTYVGSYQRLEGKRIIFDAQIVCTLGGGPATHFDFPLPVTAAAAGAVFSIYEAGLKADYMCTANSTTTGRIEVDGGSIVNAAYSFRVSGSYLAAT